MTSFKKMSSLEKTTLRRCAFARKYFLHLLEFAINKPTAHLTSNCTRVRRKDDAQRTNARNNPCAILDLRYTISEILSVFFNPQLFILNYQLFLFAFPLFCRTFAPRFFGHH
jgi:hypothetical protein